MQRDAPQVVVAQTVDEIEDLRSAWRAAEVGDIDSDIDYFLIVAQHADWVVQPYVVCIRRAGRPDLFGIARLENFPLRLAIGYRTLARPRLKAIVVTFGGIVGAETAEDYDLILTELRKPLRSGLADALVMRRLDRAGFGFRSASRLAGPFQVRGGAVSRRWLAELPDSLEAFLALRSTKTRQTIRRQDRHLEREHGDDLRLRRFVSAQDSADLFLHMEAVAATSYQRSLGAGYQGGAVDRALIEFGLIKGWLRAWVLYFGQKPVAFWTGTTCAGTFAIGTPGFDPAFGKDSVGRYTMHRMLEDICTDESVLRLDLGQGDAEYKAAFGPSQVEESDIIMIAKRPRALALGMLASALWIVNGWGRRFVKNSTRGQTFKRAWRRRLAQ